jgi:hypothetical protein
MIMMHRRRRKSVLALSLFLGAALSMSTTQAGVITVGPGAFPASSTLLEFTGLASGTEVNGLTVGGVLFTYSLANGMVQIDGGPGTTNNISPPNIVSIGNDTGILTLTLAGFADLFGYGYAILNTVPVANATTITLFSGAANVGTLSYNGVPDPTFTGGFAGIQSTVPFNRVTLTFNAAAASAFALDNVRIATVVPEPSAILLVLSGAAALFWQRRTRLR